MLSIAIDGPSGAGKSTISRLIAEKLGFIYVDTGALYRTIALYMLENTVDTADAVSVTENLSRISIETKHDGLQRMFLNGRDVTEAIRRPELSLLASAVSAIPSVREFLLDTQRSFAQKNNVIMDGRDIGTTVLPNANLKIFLTAAAEDRAKRRYLEQKEKGFDVDYDSILSDINKRDYNDSHRAVSPLTRAADAILVDTTGNELEQSVSLLYNLIIEKLGLTK
ncbi:MAG: (d)CMP kinase [Ruminococcaceae bacterium]|nr:(d)CMP kinase [Oscillospiraceae bacterium]